MLISASVSRLLCKSWLYNISIRNLIWLVFKAQLPHVNSLCIEHKVLYVPICLCVLTWLSHVSVCIYPGLDPRKNTCISWTSSWRWSGAPCSSFSMKFPTWTLEGTPEGLRDTSTWAESCPCSTAYCGKSWGNSARWADQKDPLEPSIFPLLWRVRFHGFSCIIVLIENEWRI